MMRLLRGPVLAGVGFSLASAGGCGASPEPPKSFSENVTPPPANAPGKTAQKPRGQNQQVRSFTVPNGKTARKPRGQNQQVRSFTVPNG